VFAFLVAARFAALIVSLPPYSIRQRQVTRSHAWTNEVRHPPQSGWLGEWGRLKGGCPVG